MGCHNLDPAFAALRLKYPDTIEANSTKRNDETVPQGTIVYATFPARGDMPPVRVTWYDCGLYPPRPEEFAPRSEVRWKRHLVRRIEGKAPHGWVESQPETSA